MVRMLNCTVLKREAESLEKAPHPGELGERISEFVSADGWAKWLERLQRIINQNQLGGVSTGFRAPGAEK